MVAQALARDARTAAFTRAMARAKAEQLVAYPNGDGTWTCKTYTITETGRRCDDVACSCTAGQRDTICKHAVCVIAARKWHVKPVRPQAPAAQCPGYLKQHAAVEGVATHWCPACDVEATA